MKSQGSDMMIKHVYIAIDLKSFYASVECVERKLDPLTTHLVVGDQNRSEKTICLAVSPSLKQYGITGRPRLFEVISQVKKINHDRTKQIEGKRFLGKSYDDIQLKRDRYLQLDYIIAPPRMALYLKYSRRTHEIYLKYFSPEDIHVYSIDEVFIDATHYLKTYHLSVKELTKKVILDILQETGITATAGIGTNLYLCKVAMDIMAKKMKADKNGVRIAFLNEKMYRQYLWNHRPLTDFWRIGNGYQKRLEQLGLYTMGDIARCSLGKENDYYNEDLLYDAFGINAELLIDHAWGYESCTMKDIKSYQPKNNSVGSGQVLSAPYSFDQARVIMIEMLDSLALTLVSRSLVSDMIVLTIGYDKDNKNYQGKMKIDHYGRKIPQHTHGTVHLDRLTASSRLITKAGLDWYDQNVDRSLTIRRISISACRVMEEHLVKDKKYYQQLHLFMDIEHIQENEMQLKKALKKEKRLQKATLQLKEKFGKNMVLKAIDFMPEATGQERNNSIGGHKA